MMGDVWKFVPKGRPVNITFWWRGRRAKVWIHDVTRGRTVVFWTRAGRDA